MHLLWKGKVFEALILFAKHFLPVLSHILLLVRHIFLYMSAGKGESWFSNAYMQGFLVLYCTTIASVLYCLLNVLYLCHLCIVFLPEL